MRSLSLALSLSLSLSRSLSLSLSLFWLFYLRVSVLVVKRLSIEREDEREKNNKVYFLKFSFESCIHCLKINVTEHNICEKLFVAQSFFFIYYFINNSNANNNNDNNNNIKSTRAVILKLALCCWSFVCVLIRKKKIRATARNSVCYSCLGQSFWRYENRITLVSVFIGNRLIRTLF